MWKLMFIHVIIPWAPVAALPILTPKDPVYIMNGGSLALTCEIDQDAAAFIWARNGYSSMVITNTTACSFRKSNSLDTYNYSMTCEQQRRFTMVNYKVNSNDDNTTWSCRVYSVNSTDLGNTLVVKLLMQVPAGSVQQQNGSTLSLIENQSAVLVCETDACKSSATIYWMKDGVNITNSTTNVTAISVGSDLFVSIGTLKYTGQRGDNRKILTCGAYNGSDSVQTSGKLTVTIYYPPSILALPNPYKVIECQPLNVTCQISSNPPPDRIFWTPSGEGSVPSTLYFSSMSMNNKGNYSCTTQNTMSSIFVYEQTGTSTSQIQVDVMYTPSIQGLINPYKVIEYQPLNVTCQVISNPPPDQIFWTPTGEGYVLYTLYISSVSRNKSGTYSCSAQNTMIPAAGGRQTGTSTNQIQVDVLYAARITTFVAKGNISEVLENSSLVLYCHVEINLYTVISLSFGEILISTIQSSNEITRNTTAGCLDAGRYICSATNSVMNGVTASAEISLNVQCPPQSVDIFYINRFISNQIELYFKPGSNGYRFQTFVIEYKSTASPDSPWRNSSVTDLKEHKQLMELIKLMSPSFPQEIMSTGCTHGMILAEILTQK